MPGLLVELCCALLIPQLRPSVTPKLPAVVNSSCRTTAAAVEVIRSSDADLLVANSVHSSLLFASALRCVGNA